MKSDYYSFKTPPPMEREDYIAGGYPEASSNNLLREWRDQNDEYFWRLACKTNATQLEMDLETSIDLDILYTDQAPQLDTYVSSVYTSYGLQTKEQWMIRQITQGSIYSYEELRAMIELNIHYHPTVKKNLLFNLDNYR